MDLLNAACALFVAAGCAIPNTPAIAPATQQRIAQWDGFINEASRRFALPQDWIRGVMAQESAGLALWNGKPITSAKGAMGLMQLMPDTWADMRARLHLGGDPYDPHDNILAGTAYLKDMADRFGTGAFAAYNAGPGRYAAYLAGRVALPQETLVYVARLHGNDVAGYSAVPFVVSGASVGDLFVPLSSSSFPSKPGCMSPYRPAFVVRCSTKER